MIKWKIDDEKIVSKDMTEYFIVDEYMMSIKCIFFRKRIVREREKRSIW